MMTIHEIFENQVRKTPHSPALSGEGTEFSYEALNTRANQVARLVRQQVSREDSIIGIMMDNSVEAVISIYAVLKAGFAYLPIDPGYPRDRVAYMLADAAVEMVIAGEAPAGKASALLPGGDPGLPGLVKTVLYLKGDQARIVTGNAPAPAGNGASDALNGVSGANLELAARPGQLAYVMYTSGTSGRPKGSLVEHQGVINLADWLIKLIYQPAGKPLTALLTAALVFDASVQQLFAPLLHGSRLVVVSGDTKRNPAAYLGTLAARGVEVLDITPSYLRILLGALKNEKHALALTHVLVGGEPLSRHLITDFFAAFRSTQLINVYGTTECTVDSTFEIIDPESEEVNLIGRPISKTSVYILDEQLQLRPIGETGEICIGGAGVSRGYLHNQPLTDEKFIPNPFDPAGRIYRTGDLGRYTDEGKIEYIGRKDSQVKLNGHRIELPEIEQAIKQYQAPAFTAEGIAGMQSGVLESKRCKTCLLSHNFPGIAFNEEGVCNVCTSFSDYRVHARAYFQDFSVLEALIKQQQQQPLAAAGKYDCMLLYSGGKDSTYVLYRLKEMGLRVLAFTFDNGYISRAAFKNIERTTARLGVDSIVRTAENMNEIFLESLTAEQTVCSGCFKSLTAISTDIARQEGINLIFTGLSRGQIYDTKLHGIFQQGTYDPAEVDAKLLQFRRMYHAKNDRVNHLLNVDLSEVPFETIAFVDFFRYDAITTAAIKKFLQERDQFWEKPKDTGFCSSNCMINDIGICVHVKERNYHNYEAPTSWDVRMGLLDRAEGMKEIGFAPNVTHLNKVLTEVGYFRPAISDAVVVKRTDHNQDDYLCAYLVGLPTDPNRLKAFLAQRLPGYMVPKRFVHIAALPLTPNGKLDYRRLPDPAVPGAADGEAMTQPAGDVEEAIARVLATLLGLGAVSATGDFFALGIDSIKAIQAAALLKKEGYQVDANDIFLYPSIRELAPNVRRTAPAGTASAAADPAEDFYFSLPQDELDKLFK